jgi:diphthine-ammonia ligase
LIEIIAPVDKSYENAIAQLKKEGIDTLITGDIAEVDGAPNWIRERSQPSKMNVSTPLWYRERYEIIEELIKNQFEVIYSCIKTTKLTVGWLGKIISEGSLKEMQTIHLKNGLDICGENGEYHTLVLNCPLFSKKIELKNWTVERKGELAYLKFV